GLWEALTSAHDAGVEFVADDHAQSPVLIEERAREPVIDLRLVTGRLWVEATVSDLGDPNRRTTLLPVGAPTGRSVVRRFGSPRSDTVASTHRRPVTRRRSITGSRARSSIRTGDCAWSSATNSTPASCAEVSASQS